MSGTYLVLRETVKRDLVGHFRDAELAVDLFALSSLARPLELDFAVVNSYKPGKLFRFH